MFKVFVFGSETRIKAILPLKLCWMLTTFQSDAASSHQCPSLVSVGVSRVCWTDVIFVQPWMKVNGAYYCDVRLATQTVAATARHLSSCWWLWLYRASRVRKSNELLRHRTSESGLHTRHVVSQQNRLPSFRPRLQDMDSRTGMRLSETANDVKHRRWAMVINGWTYYISQGRVETAIRIQDRWAILLHLCCKLTSVGSNTMLFDSYCKIKRVQFFSASQCIYTLVYAQ